MPTLTPPPARVTAVAVPGAWMLTSRSGCPVLYRARNSPAELPAGRAEVPGPPSTKTFRMDMSWTASPDPTVG